MPEEQKHSVMLVDSYGLLLGGFECMINSHPQMEVVTQASNLDDVERFARGHKPELVLIGFNLFAFGEEISQADLIQMVKAASPESTVLVLVRGGGRMKTVQQAMEAGADGAISAGLSKDELWPALLQALKQGGYFSTGMALEMVRHQRQEEVTPLSGREQEVLSSIAYGYTNQEIADRLFLSVRTVEAHRAAIQTKLDLGSRSEIVAYAIRHDLMGHTSPWLAHNHD